MTLQLFRKGPFRPQHRQNSHLTLSHTGQSGLDCASCTPIFGPTPQKHRAAVPRGPRTPLHRVRCEQLTISPITWFVLWGPNEMEPFPWPYEPGEPCFFYQIIHLPRDSTSLDQLGTVPERPATLNHRPATLPMLRVPHAWKPWALSPTQWVSSRHSTRSFI